MTLGGKKRGGPDGLTAIMLQNPPEQCPEKATIDHKGLHTNKVCAYDMAG